MYGDKPEPYADLHYPIMEQHPGGFDLVIFGQTFEHLYDPVLAFRNLYNSMAPGGFLFTSGPYLNHLHSHPFFFSMPTPWGLVMWFKMAGFEVLKVGSFGNSEFLENTVSKYITWWPKIRAYWNFSRTPNIENDMERPGQVWILVRKPLDAPGPTNL